MAERVAGHRRKCWIEPLENRRLLAASALVISPLAGNNSVYLAVDSKNPNIDIWHNSATPGTGTPTQTVAISSITQIIVDGGTGNDLLTQATALPVTVIFNGGSGNDTLNISAGTYTIAGDPASNTSNLSINDAGALFFDAGAAGTGIHPIHLTGLNILAGGSAMLDTPWTSADRSVLVVSSLTIASTGLLDLTGNDLIVHNGDPTGLSSLVTRGYNAASTAWRGTSGIVSSFAANDPAHLTGLGVLPNRNGSGALLASFDGVSAVSTDVLIRYTLYGDANLDGTVNSADYTRADTGYLSGATTWWNGDFNYDKVVNGSDYTLLDNAFNRQSGTQSTMNYQLNHALDVAQEQSRKTVADLGTSGLYPQYVNTDGSISNVSNTHWTVGTWAGLLWNLYESTGNSYFKTEATAFTNPLSVDQTQTSDVGFRIYDSFAPLLQQSSGTTASNIITIMENAAAAKLTTYNAKVGAFEAWRNSTSGNPAANFNVLMDLIMDSPLLFWTAKQTGNQTYYNDAVSNAVIEENDLVHADGTSSQFAYFNASNGAFVDNETYQGYSNTSTWARGEAWAIYGFAQCYAATGRADFLATSEKTADWFLSHLPSDDVPYWDFNAPVNSSTYRDTSAAAVAASGLLQLSKLIATSDPTNSTRYRNAAGSILASLASTKYLNDPMSADNGTLLHGALNVPANVGDDNPIYFGDYYFTEAVNAYLGL